MSMVTFLRRLTSPDVDEKRRVEVEDKLKQCYKRMEEEERRLDALTERFETVSAAATVKGENLRKTLSQSSMPAVRTHAPSSPELSEAT
jgi:hypothetical protein